MIFYDILCIYIYIHNYKYVKYAFIYAYIYIYIHDLIYVYRFFVCHGSPAGELTSCALDLFPQPWPILHHLKDSGATVGTRSHLHCTRCSWGILGLPHVFLVPKPAELAGNPAKLQELFAKPVLKEVHHPCKPTLMPFVAVVLSSD